MVKDVFCVIRNVNLETFRHNMALNIKSAEEDLFLMLIHV